MSTDQPARDVLLTARGLGPSVLAFAVTALVVFVEVDVKVPWSYFDPRRDFWEHAPPESSRVAVGLFALVCGAIVAASARLRRPVGALLALLSGCVALIAVSASRLPCFVVSRSLGGVCCDQAGWYSELPTQQWAPRALLLLVAILAPVVLVAQSARRRPAIDARARVAFGLGASLVAVAVVAALPSPANLTPSVLLTLVGALLQGVSVVDANRRARALSRLADDSESDVTPARDDDPADLPLLVTLPSRLSIDGVVRVDKPVRRDAYRAPRLRVAVARCPVDVRATAQFLHRRVRVRWALLAVSLLVATLMDHIDRAPQTRRVVPIVLELH